MKKFAIGFGAMILLTAFGDDVYFNVKEGNRLYKEEKYSQSLEQYRNAQNGDPESKAVDYNLGGALYKLGRYGEAAQAYAKAMTSGDDRIKKEAGYNLGTALLKGGEKAQKEMKPDEAGPMLMESVKQLKLAALDSPDNIDARHNLELAIKLLEELEKQKQEQKQDQQEGDKKEGDKSENDGKEDNKANEDKQKRADTGEQDKKKSEEEKNKEKRAKSQDSEMTPEKARQIMGTVERGEAELREKMRAGKPEDTQKHDKDW